MRRLRAPLWTAALIVLGAIVAAAVLVDVLTPYVPDAIDVADRSRAPTLDDGHLLGTDRLGRDYLTRVLHATRTSLLVAGVVTAVSTAVGTAVGAIAGYRGGRIDGLLMRATDFVLALPGLVVLLVAAAYLGRGAPLRIAVLLGLLLWPTIARVVRAVFLSLRERDFVAAARAAGARGPRIVRRHLLPHAVGVIVANAGLVAVAAILIEATLSFLGVGIQPPRPALGKLVDDGVPAMLTDWWLVTVPGVLLVVLCVAIHLVADGLRGAVEPDRESAG